MRRILFMLFTVVLCCKVFARHPYECVTPGTHLVYTSFNKNGKATDCYRTEVIGVEGRDNCQMIRHVEYSLDAAGRPILDKLGREMPPDTVLISMDKESVYRDWIDLLDGIGTPLEMDTARLKKEGLEYRYFTSGTQNYVFPDAMQTGDTLCVFQIHDGLYNIGTNKSSFNSNIHIITYVQSKELIRTPAGNFDCMKVITDVEYKVVAPLYRPKRWVRIVSWVMPDIGIVRVGSVDKKGRLNDYVELTRIDWPDTAR